MRSETRSSLALTARTKISANYTTGLQNDLQGIQGQLHFASLTSTGQTVNSDTGAPLFIGTGGLGVQAGLFQFKAFTASVKRSDGCTGRPRYARSLIREVASASPRLPANWLVIVAAGLLVGFGTRLGGGCTSGHGICGIGRLSMRSIAATIVFMTTAVITVAVTHHVLGG